MFTLPPFDESDTLLYHSVFSLVGVENYEIFIGKMFALIMSSTYAQLCVLDNLPHTRHSAVYVEASAEPGH